MKARSASPAKRTSGRGLGEPGGSPRSPARGALDQKLLVLITLALVAFGLVMVYSATSTSATLGNEDPMSFLKRQSAYALLGIVAMAVASRLDYHGLRYLAGPLLLVAFVLCAAVLVVGPAINGAHRWFLIGPASFQPSEIAKLALCLFAAAYLSRRSAPRTLGGLMKPLGLLAAIFCGLVLLEPDLGTTISLCGMLLAIFFVAGVPARLLAVGSALALAIGTVAIWAEPYRRARVFSFLDPWKDAQGSGFQIVQATIGIGSGGVTGVGLGQGVEKALYLPEAHTDMIFAVIGEELGLVGSILVVAAFAAFGFVGFRIALRCRDPFGKFLAAGLTSLVCGQAALNLAAVLGIAPLTGIPLPFVSYGGSSLVVLLAGVGILLNIAVNEKVARARMPDRGRRDRRARAAGARRRRSASSAGSDGDLRRVSRPRRVAARS
jgi:cell division protein FtsW